MSAEGDFSINVVGRIVTSLGTISYSAGTAFDINGKPLSPQAASASQLIICRDGSNGQECQAYKVDTSRRIRIAMDGQFVTTIEGNRYRIDVRPGSRLSVTDDGPPVKLAARGPARVDVEEFDFRVDGNETEVDFERSESGFIADLSYDHVTGQLSFLNGAKVGRVDTFRQNSWRSPANNVPSEFECQETPDYRDNFTAEELDYSAVVACTRTAEGDFGYTYIEPDTDEKPASYYVYTYTWVR